MPATLFSDLEFSTSSHHSNGGQSQKTIEDTRALQVALELSMLYMNSDQRQQHQQKAESPMSGGPSSMDHGSSMQQNNGYGNIPNGFPEEPRNKKSQNMTECVPVPSSEHVAEIVGRQGKYRFSLNKNIFHPNISYPRSPSPITPTDYDNVFRYSRSIGPMWSDIGKRFDLFWGLPHVGLFSESVGIPGRLIGRVCFPLQF